MNSRDYDLEIFLREVIFGVHHFPGAGADQSDDDKGCYLPTPEEIAGKMMCFDHASPEVRRFWLCGEKCGPVFHNGSKALRDYMMAIILWQKLDQPDDMGDRLDNLWYKLDACDITLINSLKESA